MYVLEKTFVVGHSHSTALCTSTVPPTPDLNPAGCRSLVQEDLKKYKMPHLRHCVSAGEPLNEEVIYNWEEATGIVIKGQ